ncbi:hypothetical protein BDW59DRAFT_167079 [Aspergillus cavernicola]|uniref:Uncharacterized protein n=1 Tax=Aspergillus cavernicola TaxID=176166 RepID=A0ABR4HGR4_9EURO
MVARSRPVGHGNERSQSDDGSSDVSEIFSDNESESDSNTDPELDSEDSDSDSDGPDDKSFNDEGQLPPEYYLAQAESLDVVALVAQEKDLDLAGRLKKNMYIEDVAEFARVLLTTTEMMFDCGWQCIQMHFFC